jgi:ribosomal-protein-alanine N-acetyltransferase
MVGYAGAVTPVPPVFSERLELASMSHAYISAVLRGDLDASRRELDVELPAELTEELTDDFFLMHLRMEQIETDPAVQQWLLRLMIPLSGPRRAVGHIGFHSPPDGEGRVEVGYTVFPAYRRRGLATEACRALFAWAGTEHGITRFRASVSPTNDPSLSLVRKLGFRRTGERDEIDGGEFVFHLDR